MARWRSRLLEEYLGQAPLSALGAWSLRPMTERPTGPHNAPQLEADTVRIWKMGPKAPETPERQAITTGKEFAPAGHVVVSHVPGKLQRSHRIVNLCGHCSQWSRTSGFRFGRSGVSIMKLDDIEGDMGNAPKGASKILRPKPL